MTEIVNGLTTFGNQFGPIALFALLLLLGAAALVKYVIKTMGDQLACDQTTALEREKRLEDQAAAREAAAQKEAKRREEFLQSMYRENEQRLVALVDKQSEIITRQGQTLESQSIALNRLADKLDELATCVSDIQKRLDIPDPERRARAAHPRSSVPA
jgi:hypothetical protein